MQKTLSQRVKRSAQVLATAGLVGLASLPGCASEEQMRKNVAKKAYLDSIFQADLAKSDARRDSIYRINSLKKDSLARIKATRDSVKADSIYSFYGFGEKDTGSFRPSIAIGDLDGDGDLDLVVVDQNKIMIYQNRMLQNKVKPYSSEAQIKPDTGVKK